MRYQYKDYYSELEFRQRGDTSHYFAFERFDTVFKVIVDRQDAGYHNITVNRGEVSYSFGRPLMSQKVKPEMINRVCNFISSCNADTPIIYIEWVLRNIAVFYKVSLRKSYYSGSGNGERVFIWIKGGPHEIE